MTGIIIIIEPRCDIIFLLIPANFLTRRLGGWVDTFFSLFPFGTERENKVIKQTRCCVVFQTMHIYSKKIDYDKHIQPSTIKYTCLLYTSDAADE